MRYIKDHIEDSTLSLDTVSENVDLSSSYLSTFFIQETGTGFRDYVNTLRIEAAKNYLKNTQLSVHEIAKHCGFTSDSYFITVFKKYIHDTPGNYRKTGIIS